MKSIKFFFACVLALTFVACSNAESDSFEDNTSNFESMKSLYGIESAAYDPKAEEIPSVTAEEMASVLEALRQVILSVTVNRKQQKDFMVMLLIRKR